MTASAGALVPQVGERPAAIKFNGGWIYLGVHDATYLRDRAAWKARIAQAHPDKGGTRGRFLDAYRGYRLWQRAELEWYATFDFEPPRSVCPYRRNLLRAIERDVIQEALRTAGSVKQAARVLGMARATLYSKMHAHAITTMRRTTREVRI